MKQLQNTSDEKCLVTEAYQELDMCCETLCHKQSVYDYIKYLEKKIEELESGTTN